MRYLISLLISNLLIFQPAFATLNNVDKTQIFSKNLLTNGGFENGKAQWTPNDTADFTTSTTTPLEGGVNAEWDADADTDTLTSTAVTIPSGWYGRNGVASCLFVTPSGTATHEIQAYDGSNVLSEATITSSTSPTRTSTNFIFPSSGSISLRIYANADEPNLELDSCFLGPAEGYNVSSVSQATFVGGMEQVGAASCLYSESTSTGLSDFDDLGVGSGCNAWTVVSNGPGTISAQGTNDHRLVYTNMPPGNYTFRLEGLFNKSNDGACIFRLSDGTNNYQVQGLTSSAAGSTSINNLEFSVSLSSAASKTYKLQAADSIVGSCSWLNDDASLNASWKVYRFPTSSEQAYTPDLQAMSWSGYFDNTCSFARANTAYGDATDASCNLTERTNQGMGSVTSNAGTNIGINFTPKKVGRYYVCAHAKLAVSTANVLAGTRLWDGATVINEAETVAATTSNNGSLTHSLCGIYVVSSVSAKTLSVQSKISSGTVTITPTGASSAVEWSIFSLDQSLPAPVLTNMVTTSASGGLRTEYVTFGGASDGGTCTSSPCTIHRTSGAVSSVTRSSTGIYVINFSPAFSAAPTCGGSAANATGPAIIFPGIHTTSVAYINVARGSPEGYSDGYVNLICSGPK